MKSKIFISLIVSLVLVLNQSFSYSVYADEYVVSGNGDGSSSQVNIQENKANEVHQDNNTETKNDVSPTADSGSNLTNSNTGGDSSVQSGDANQQVVVSNSGNVNQASVGCCPQDNSAKITDNGSGSSNQINSNQSETNNISQNNGAKIINNVAVSANTGDNEVSNNSGDVKIVTGNVNTRLAIANQVNYSSVTAASGTPGFNLNVSGNGTGSNNQANNSFTANNNFLVNNYLELNNNISNYSNTGGNNAKGNNGKVLITTGNVYLDIILNNKVNISKAIVDCGCKPSASPSPTPTPSPSGSPTPSTPPGGGENGGGGSSGGSSGGGESSSSSGSSSGGQVLGATLPATGGFSIFQATAVALLMLVSGVLLRLDYGKKKKPERRKDQKKVSLPFTHEFTQDFWKFINFKLPLPVPRYLFAHH